ncbi:MAG: DUF2027 domain-containing protein [Bacteroidales bacterium]|nr:DUF2027 domain-containing protein [Bacteroidales bacterium]
MDLKPGDKVKFLNEEGGGIVSKVLENNMVAVTIEDGFDIPTLRSNLIKIESQGVAGDMFSEDYKVPERDEEVSRRTDQQSRIMQVQPHRDMEQAVHLVFQTESEKSVITGDLDVYLLNNTRKSIYYAIYLEEEGQLKLQFHGHLSGLHREYLKTISREQLEKWSSGIYQLMLIDEKTEPVAPVTDIFKIKAKRFYKEDNYRNYMGWNNKVFAFKLLNPEWLPKAKDVTGAVTSGRETKTDDTGSTVVSRTAIIDKHVTGEGEAKVDLHIEKFVDDHKRMNSMEILNVQLSYFRRVLESALQNNIRRLIIIHGVGAGILKAEIRRELEEYDYIEVHDAPIAEFGVGATIARIFQQ